MSRRTCLILGVTAALTWAVMAVPGSSTPPPPDPAAKELPELLRQLGSKVFAERERASKQLRQRKDAVPFLEKLLPHADAEVQQRARQLLEHHRGTQNPLHELIAQKDSVPIDLLIDSMVYHHDSVDEKVWSFLQDLAQGVSTKVKMQPLEPGDITWPKTNYLDYQCGIADRMAQPRIHILRLLANQVTAERHITCSLIACRGSITVKRSGSSGAILLANNDVTITPTDDWYAFEDGLLFCDGNVHCGRIADSVVLATGSVKSLKSERSVVIDHAKGLEKFFRLFDLKDVGIDVQHTARGWQVKAVDSASVFANAGVLTGDVIVAFRNRPKTKIERFRQVVRGCVAERATLVLQIERAGQPRDVSVSFVAHGRNASQGILMRP